MKENNDDNKETNKIKEEEKNKEVKKEKKGKKSKKKKKDEETKKEETEKTSNFINVISKEIKKEDIEENKETEENKENDKNKENAENIEDKENNNKIVETLEDKIKEKNPTKIRSSVVTTGKEKINDIYLKKVNDLSNIYNYTSNYLAFISQMFKKISEPFYSKLSSSYINNVKPYLKYFKELVHILNTFSEKLNVLNSSVEDKKDENEDENLIRVENNLNSAIKKLNIVFADTSSSIVKNLKETIINKPLFAKFESIEGKFEDNFHKMLNLISQLEQYRIKYNNEYNKKYVNIFNTYIQKYNEMDNYLITMKDFFIIEDDIVNTANQCIEKINKFLEDIKKLYEDSTSIFCDYLEMLKIMIKIYYEENKKIILTNVLSEKMVNDLEKLVGQDIRKNIEKKFCIKNIIEYYRDEALRNDINHLLLKYQDILVQYKILENDDINNLSLFNIKNFKSTELFFKFLLSLIPPKFKVNYEDLIQFKTNVKRDCGIFKGWKESNLVISYQGHILFFDEEELPKNTSLKKRSQSGHSISVGNEKEMDIQKDQGLSEIHASSLDKKIMINNEKKVKEERIEKSEKKKNNEKEEKIEKKEDNEKVEKNEQNEKNEDIEKNEKNKNNEKNEKKDNKENNEIIENNSIKKSISGKIPENNELKYGISPEKLSIMYYKTSYGIQKKNNKQGKFLFEIWEKGIGNKKSKINSFDALDQKNLENILLELTETNIYDD